MRFEGKVVVVTGASRGIGAAVAVAFGSEGAKVACVATVEKNAATTAQQIGSNARAYGCDVADPASVEDLFHHIEAEMGTVDVLVNNAGVTRDALIVRMDEDDWDVVQAVNLKGSWLCCKAVARSMMKARKGRIVNVSSIVGLSGSAGQTNYAASKAGLIGLTKALAKELGSRGITCNAVAPGFIETDMTADLPEESRAAAVASAPAGRLGTPEDIAAAVLYLASDEASFVTGQTLVVDGGLTL